MKEIQLYAGRGVALVDDQDYLLLSSFSWHLTFYGYARANMLGDKVLMHRFILHAKGGEEIDHINGNRLDNRRSNLRFCSASQNHANSRRYASNGTGYKGVSWNKNAKMFSAKIRAKEKQYHLGYYKSALDAALAYDEAAIKLFGEFAGLNFPKVVIG